MSNPGSDQKPNNGHPNEGNASSDPADNKGRITIFSCQRREGVREKSLVFMKKTSDFLTVFAGSFVNHLSATSALWSCQILCTYFAWTQDERLLDRSFIHPFSKPFIPSPFHGSTCLCERVFLSIRSQFRLFQFLFFFFASMALVLLYFCIVFGFVPSREDCLGINNISWLKDLHSAPHCFDVGPKNCQ